MGITGSWEQRSDRTQPPPGKDHSGCRARLMGRRVLTTEVREDGGLEVGSDFGSGARWSDSSYILKLLEFADGPGVGVRD